MYVVSADTQHKAHFLETNKTLGFNEPAIPALEKHWSIKNQGHAYQKQHVDINENNE